MTDNVLLPFTLKVQQSVRCFLVGDTRVTFAKSKSDFNTLVLSSALFVGMLLDFNDIYCCFEERSTVRGRIKSFASTYFTTSLVDISSLLKFLDSIGDMSLEEISSPTRFNPSHLRSRIEKSRPVAELFPLKGIILSLYDRTVKYDTSHVACVTFLRQLSSLLKKIEVNRPDLDEAARADYISAEAIMAKEVKLNRASIDYLTDVFEMSVLARRHITEFRIGPLVTRHGPGAVAEKGVRSWFEKHSTARTDSRIQYLLLKSNLGTVSDYLPLVKEEKGTRINRFCAVPKNWKKLRGISAEPAELAYFQQGVAHSINRLLQNDKFWSSSIDLHNQEKSRKLALQGSSSQEYSTVDLSSASDSVTLQLVKDLFGSTELCRWLLATRSLTTDCGGLMVKMNKFAPMGSACCFPVETMIFTLAAKLAVKRTRIGDTKVTHVQVFGDDIIIPTYATQELFNILSHLGFSVNAEKSYWQGYFREACGVEAWEGHDVSPCRFKHVTNSIMSPNVSFEEFTSVSSFCNELLLRGMHETREFLLHRLMCKSVQVGKRDVTCQNAMLFSFTGKNGTLVSFCPTNFHVRKRRCVSYQTLVYHRLVWTMKPVRESYLLAKKLITPDSIDLLSYNDWLIRHQKSDTVRFLDNDSSLGGGWRGDFLVSTNSPSWTKLPIGNVMVPTLKWVTFPNYESLLG